jgi:16S rRNA (adenine1518-N6/adenine1519-N6)-dimethyltransferase
MLQKEVVDRMVAEPGSKDFGRLSVMLQYRYHMERLFVVPPGAFNPPPKVDSAIVRMIPKDEVGGGGLCIPGMSLRDQLTATDPALFARVVTAAFSQRRKMLRNTLREYIGEAELAALGITPTARAEDIAVADYVRLANTLADLARR